jgi:hypothetical protein
VKEEIRKENNCLNCGAELIGPFCHICGQKNLELHVGFFELIGELIADYFHFDTRIFTNLRYLLFRPGFLINEFNSGKRVKYVHPFRLFIFVTIIFFVCYFSFSYSSSVNSKSKTPQPKNLADISKMVTDSVKNAMKNDSSSHLNVHAISDVNKAVASRPDSIGLINFSSKEKLPATYDKYADSLKRLPPDKRPSWITNTFMKQYYKSKEMGADKYEKALVDQFEHDLPKMMFFLIPFIALILKLLYVRRHIYYINHLVFTLYTHSFVFILLILSIPLSYFYDFTGWIVLISLIYILFSMRKVYKQGWAKTILKLFIFLFIYLIFLSVAMGFTLAFAAATL